MGIEIGPPKRAVAHYPEEETFSSEKLVEFPIIKEVLRKVEHNIRVLRRILAVG